MKKITFLFLLFSTISFTQTIESLIQKNNLNLSEVEFFVKQNNLQIPIDGCVDFPNPDYSPQKSNYSKSIQKSTQNETQYVFNVYFHVINEDDGTREIPIGENEIMDAVALLNINYNPFNIFFKYIGYNDINDSDWTTVANPTAFQNLRTYAIDNNYYIEEAFNVFICEEFGSGSGIAFKPGTMSLIEDEDLLTSALQHEIAHNFLIHHIHQPSNACEYENGTNSDIAGDLVTDTNAAHPIDIDGADNIIGNEDDEVVLLNGIYSYNNANNNRTDCINTAYTNVQILNYMASNSYLGIRNSFTNGQGVRMRETIENNLTTIYGNVQNTIESLYQPFDVSIIEDALVISVTDNTPNNGMATVCRNIVTRHRFQKGFDYIFTQTNDSDSSYTDANTLPVIVNAKDQISVKIEQIDNSQQEIIIPVIYSDGQICNEEAYVSGKTLTSHDMGSGQFIIKKLTEQEASDPNLEQSLDSKKYHVIQKTTSTGLTIQKIIYKKY